MNPFFLSRAITGNDGFAAKDMDMQVKDFLPPAVAGIDHGSEAIVHPLLAGQFSAQQKHSSQHRLMNVGALGKRIDMNLGNDQKVNSGNRVDVMKRQKIFVLENFLAWNLVFQNLGECSPA